MYEKDNYNTFNIFNNHVIIYGKLLCEPVVEVVTVVVVEEVLQVRGNSYHDHYYGRRGRSNPIEGIVMTVVVV